MSNYTGIAEILNHTEYSVLHGWQNLPDKLDSDLDIVINPTHLNQLERSLLKGKEGKLVQLLQHESSCYYFVLAHKNGGGMEFLKVDAATDYRRDGFTYFTADQFIRRRHKWNSFWVTSPNSEFPYLLVKKTLKGSTPEHQKKRFYELVSELGIKKSKRLAANLFGKKLGYRIVSWIYTNEWDKIESQLPTLRRALFWHKLIKNPINPIMYWVMELKRKVLRWRYPTGLFVVVLGPDGSGKTTLIDSLKTQLLGAFRTADIFHLRPNIFGRNKNDNPVTDPHGKPTRSGLISAFKVIYYAFDYFVGYLLKIHTKLVRSTLVIFDRYFDDMLIDPKRYRYGGGKWLVNLCNYFVPEPDMYLILDVDENELMKRKQEVSIEELRRQRIEYRRLASKLKNAHIIDGSADEKQVLNDASEIVMNYLHNRYVERRGLWFEDDPYSSLDWLNTILSPDNKKTMFNITDSKKSKKSSEW
ncbi:MAG: dTMP kinase, partial [Thermodesulfobacteriota bacterium]